MSKPLLHLYSYHFVVFFISHLYFSNLKFCPCIIFVLCKTYNYKQTSVSWMVLYINFLSPSLYFTLLPIPVSLPPSLCVLSSFSFFSLSLCPSPSFPSLSLSLSPLPPPFLSLMLIYMNPLTSSHCHPCILSLDPHLQQSEPSSSTILGGGADLWKWGCFLYDNV